MYLASTHLFTRFLIWFYKIYYSYLEFLAAFKQKAN